MTYLPLTPIKADWQEAQAHKGWAMPSARATAADAVEPVPVSSKAGVSIAGLDLFSGKVRLCSCGLKTHLRDMEGKKLFSGDIVAIYGDRYGEEPSYKPTLTAVVVEADGDPFVMGIKSVPLADPGYWRVWKLKSYADVVAGERWIEWGFHYESAQ